MVYPDGFEAHWNGCRAAGPYAANTLDVDDVGFMRSIVARLVAEDQADPAAVFATGISNGGHMAIRLALEAPDFVQAVAPIVASLPSEENLACDDEGVGVAFLLINGTEDPMNPYGGGDVALYGIAGNRGGVQPDLLAEDGAVPQPFRREDVPEVVLVGLVLERAVPTSLLLHLCWKIR